MRPYDMQSELLWEMETSSETRTSTPKSWHTR